MEFLDRELGPMRYRAWGLVLNMGFNALALYGLSRVMGYGDGQGILAGGVIGTVACIAVVAIPYR
ncbi:hypothetical protein [Haliea sp.]